MAGRPTSTRARIRIAVSRSQNGSLPTTELFEELPRYSRDSIVIAILHEGIESKRLTHLFGKISQSGFKLAQGRRGGKVPDRFVRDGQLAQVVQQLALCFGGLFDLQGGDLAIGHVGQDRVRQMGKTLALRRRTGVSPDLPLRGPHVTRPLLFDCEPDLVDKKKMRHPARCRFAAVSEREFAETHSLTRHPYPEFVAVQNAPFLYVAQTEPL